MKLVRTDAVRFGTRLYTQASQNDLSGAAAELAFRFFLALFPFCIFLAALGGFVARTVGVDNPTDQIMNAVGKSLPSDANSVLRGQIDSVITNRNLGLVSIGILGSIWAAAGGVGTIMKTMNRVYGVRETRSIFRRYAISLALTLSGGLLLIGAFFILVIGQVYGGDIAARLGAQGIAEFFLKFIRLPFVLLLTLTATAVLYWAAPNARLPFRLVTPGAVLFAVGWLAASVVFGLYVSHFGQYNVTYGTLGGVAVALIWFYITGFILLLGAQVNAVVEREKVSQLPATWLPELEQEDGKPHGIEALMANASAYVAAVKARLKRVA